MGTWIVYGHPLRGLLDAPVGSSALMARVELSLARHFNFGAAYHFWRAGRMMGMPRLPGESTAAYGDRLLLAMLNKNQGRE